MSDLSASRLWLQRGVFIALSLAILIGHLLPLQTQPTRWVTPDLLICIALCWSMRRPDAVPLGLLAGVFLMADFLLQRPPGLWAALALIACAHVQARATILRAGGFATEYLRIGLLICAITLGARVILAAFLLPLPSLGLSLLQTVLTVLAYPLVVGVALLLGLRDPSTELESFGARS